MALRAPVARGDSNPLVLPFGRHRGQHISQVPDSYLAWLVRTAERAPPALRWGARRELERRPTGAPPQALATPEAVLCDHCYTAGCLLCHDARTRLAALGEKALAEWRAIQSGAIEAPDDPAPWLVLADWLEDHEFPAEAGLARQAGWCLQGGR